MDAAAPSPATLYPITTRLVPVEMLACVNNRVAENTLFAGEFTSEEPSIGLRIDGALQGSVCLGWGSTVHIGATGIAPNTQIEADHVVIEGQASGTIVARVALEITSTAQVRGELVYGQLLDIHPGARVRAQLAFRSPLNAPAAAEAPAAPLAPSAPFGDDTGADALAGAPAFTEEPPAAWPL